jgi:hypothetical protein
VFIGISIAGRSALRDSWAVHGMLFLWLAIALAWHQRQLFLDTRVHLTPGFRRVQVTVAALAALLVVGILPATMAWFAGRSMLGVVAPAALLFGIVLWVVVNDASWTAFAILFGWAVVCVTDAGLVYCRALLAGQHAFHAVAILVLGILVILRAAAQLVQLTAEEMSYDSTLHWNRDWNEKTRQGCSSDRRILRGLRDWLHEREMTRATRLARRASPSWWSRIGRWQVGLVAGWSLVRWMLEVLIYVQAVSWWIVAKSPRPAAAMIGMTSMILTSLPAIVVAAGAPQWRKFKLGREALLPVERIAYIRQLGLAAAASHFALWAGIGGTLVLWWLVAGPQPLPLSLLAIMLLYSAAFQIAAFGLSTWAARFRASTAGTPVLFALFVGAQVLQLRWVQAWSLGLPGQLREVLAISGVLAGFGLLATWDAYRRWLVADFD